MKATWNNAHLQPIPEGESDPAYHTTIDLTAQKREDDPVMWYERGGKVVRKSDLEEPKPIGYF